MTSDAGETFNFSEQDIQDIASCYDPAKREAPLCIGHPANNLPAYGWVNKLQRKREVADACEAN